MWVYYLVSLSLFSLAWSSRHNSHNSRQLFFLSLPLIFIFVSARWAVGCDFFAYKSHFDAQDPTALGESIPSLDPFYWILIDFLSYAGLPFQAVLVVCSAIFFFGFYIFSKRFTNPMATLAFSFPIMIFAVPMSAMRQAMASGFLLFAFSNLIDRRHFVYAIFVLLAAQFHSSAIIFIAFLPLVYFGGGLKSWLLTLPLLLVGTFYLMRGESYEVASMRYIESRNDAGGAVFRTFLLFAAGLYYWLFLRNRWRYAFPESFSILNVSAIFMIGSFPATLISPTIADRLGFYLLIFAAVIAAGIPVVNSQRRDTVFLVAIIGLAVFFVSWSQLSWQLPYCYAPYQTWFFEPLPQER